MQDFCDPPQTGPAANRRRHPRVPADAVPDLSAHLVGGPPVRLLDISLRGARLETSRHLRPGHPVNIRFETADTTLTLLGAVVRSSVAMLSGEGVKYHTALAFNEDLLVCPDVEAAEPADDPAGDGAAPRVDGAADIDDVVMVVAVPEESSASLRGRLLASD